MGGKDYGKGFYENIREGSRRSARAVAPIVMELIHPKTVVDIGCGQGVWLSVFQEYGATDTLGLDGDYVDREGLQIPEDQFRPTDLSSPFSLPRTFDLAISVEVAEHLPAESAEGFIDSLVRLAPVVLFSAAVPFQGGSGHLNEQWPEYWAELFKRHNYLPIDCIRAGIWGNQDVEWWYAQNCFVFASDASLRGNDALRVAFERTNPHQMSLVHPRKHLETHRFLARPEFGVRIAAGILARSLKKSMRRRLRVPQ